MSDLLYKNQFRAKEARDVAGQFIAHLGVKSSRIEIVGSLRRQAPWVGDIEILVEPLFGRNPTSLYGEENWSLIHEELDLMLREKLIAKDPQNEKWGERYRRFIYQGVPVDCFICMPPRQWGVLKFIRTGHVNFTKPYVTKKDDGGKLPMGMRVAEGQLLHNDVPIPCDTEEAFFEAIGIRYVEPQYRK